MLFVSLLLCLVVVIVLGVFMQVVQVEEEVKELGMVIVVGDWLGEVDQVVVQNYFGVCSVVCCWEMFESGVQNVCDVLCKVFGV